MKEAAIRKSNDTATAVTSHGVAIDNSPQRELWDRCGEDQSPGGATEHLHARLCSTVEKGSTHRVGRCIGLNYGLTLFHGWLSFAEQQYSALLARGSR